MANQLVINATLFETRIALIENGSVSEVFIERKADRGFLGNIYLGKVQRVLPGMQAAFIEIGLDKAGFLYVTDILPYNFKDNNKGVESYDLTKNINNISKVFLLKNKKNNNFKYKIENLLTHGQQILVQVIKNPIGNKGSRLSCNISVPGRHVVYMPTYNKIGVSRKIVDPLERERLKNILINENIVNGGFVIRTVARKISKNKLREDAIFLVSMWKDVKKRSERLSAPSLVFEELDIVLKLSRDMINDNLEKIIVDDLDTFKRCEKFLQILGQNLHKKLEKFNGTNPIFNHYSIESEISRGMCRKVLLKSGGYLIIDQAEALVVIDVNTGRFVGRQNLKDTILRTNLEAVIEVAYQLRLRNVGGMIIIDFIDMESVDDQNHVLQLLIKSLNKDKARCSVIRMSELGFVEMTRQRSSENISQQLCEPCFYCDGSGTLRSKRTVAYDIFRKLLQKKDKFSEPVLVVNAHPEVVDLIYSEEAFYLSQIEKEIKKNILIRPRGSFHQEQIDIFGLANI